MSQAPLTGVRVLDFSHHVAGPYCTKLLAEFGADVIKVERPNGGDPARMRPPFYHDLPDPDGSLLFLHLNTSKRSLAIDLKSAGGLRVAKELVAKADIVVENFSPRTMDRLGLGYDAMRQINPATVVVSISNFGQTGPYRDFRISEIVAYAMGGSMQSSGHAKKEPLKLAGNSVQYHCGSVAAFAAMAAFTGAELTGAGDHIDCSLYETQMGSRDRRAIYLTNYQYTGEPSKRVDTVMLLGGGVRPTSDGYIMIAGGGKRLPNLLRMIGREDLIEVRRASATPKELDPAFVEDVEHSLLEWSLARTKAEALAESQKHHIVGGVVNTIADLFMDPHFVERNPWYVIDHPTTGPQTYPGAPFRLSKSEQPTPRHAPRLGEHNREVLAELGYAPADQPTIQPRPDALSAGSSDATNPHGPSASARDGGAAVNELPLAGLRVVDITVVWAGPHCTQLLAEWGAEVIRVEPRNRAQPSTRSVDRLTRDDVVRLRAAGQGALYAYPDFDPAGVPWNRTPAFNSHARNKLSMTCDIMSPEGLDILKRLVAISDVLVENNAAETIEKARITYEKLVKVNPRLIMLRMTAYGLSGPYKYYRSFGNQMESMTGQHYLRGYPDMDPSATGSSFTADAAGGVNGALAVLMALRHRRLTGEGQLIELPLAETTLPYLGEIIMDYTVNGRMAEPNGNAHPLNSPHGAYPTAGEDRWIAVDVATDEEWQRLAAIIGEPWTAMAEFATSESRITNRAAMDAHMSEWTNAFDAVALFQSLQAAGVTAGPVQGEGLAYDCPHLEERGFFVEITHPDAGTHRYPGMNIKMENTPNEVRRYPVRLGEDNDYVYRDLIGVTEAEYDALKEKGHIGTDFLPSAYV